MNKGFLALAAVLPLLLAGCGGDDDPQPKMPETQAASATPTPSASPTGPVEPVEPVETEGAGAKAAIAYVEHYFAMVDFAQTAGDTSGLAALALDSCVPCKGGLDGIRKSYEKGGHIEGGAHTVSNATVGGADNFRETGIFTVKANVAHTEEVRHRSKGAAPEVYKAGSNVWVLTLLHDDAGWHISDWDITT